MATPDQIVRQIERCWRENVPGWRVYITETCQARTLREWAPTADTPIN